MIHRATVPWGFSPRTVEEQSHRQERPIIDFSTCPAPTQPVEVAELLPPPVQPREVADLLPPPVQPRGADGEPAKKKARKTRPPVVALPVKDFAEEVHRHLVETDNLPSASTTTLLNMPVLDAELTTKEERKNSRVDLWVRFGSGTQECSRPLGVKVLERRPFLEQDVEQDEHFWVQLRGTKSGDDGYLNDPQVDLLAQQIAGGFVLMRRAQLKDLIYSKISEDGAVTTELSEAIYGTLRRGSRRERHTIVPAADVLATRAAGDSGAEAVCFGLFTSSTHSDPQEK